MVTKAYVCGTTLVKKVGNWHSACAESKEILAKENATNKVKLLGKADNTYYTKRPEENPRLFLKAHFPTATQILGAPDLSSYLKYVKEDNSER